MNLCDLCLHGHETRVFYCNSRGTCIMCGTTNTRVYSQQDDARLRCRSCITYYILKEGLQSCPNRADKYRLSPLFYHDSPLSIDTKKIKSARSSLLY